MYNLIPRLVHQQYGSERRHGRIQGGTLFLDIAGFTVMTRELMERGREGAEVLAALLNRVFAPVIRCVYERRGWIAGFAGDALTCVFPVVSEPTEEGRALPGAPLLAAAAQATLEAAQEIACFFTAERVQQTALGTFELSVKIGLSAGEVEWGIVGPAEHKGYFVRGPAMDGCAHAVERARPGEVVIDPALQKLLPADAGHSAGLEAAPRREALAEADSFRCTEAVLARFHPQLAAPATQTVLAQGEFREVALIFLSFEGLDDLAALDSFASLVARINDRFDGYWSGLEFGDKGGLFHLSFGAPLGHEDNVERALRFAFALREQAPALPTPALRWRAGITFGLVYTGMIGSPLRGTYTWLGDTVNLAARLATNAGWGEILTSESVAHHRRFVFEELGERSYKGFARPLPTFRLVGTAAGDEILYAHPMVGRTKELRDLEAAAAPALDGRFAGAVMVYGDPGIGKSRLFHELRRRLSEARARWFVGQVDPILRQPFNPFVYFLQRYFEQSPDVSDARNRERFERSLGRLEERLQAEGQESRPLVEELRRTASIIGALLNLHWPGSLYESLDAQARHQNTILAIANLLLAESRLQPVILELEDAQWLDDSSQEVLGVLTRELAASPFLLLASSRYADDGSHPELSLAPGTPRVALDLDLLSPVALEELTTSILGAPGAPALQHLLRERTQANPFFAQQLLYYFQDQRLLLMREGQWTLGDAAFELPSSINAILVARIDRLAERTREVVKVASVLGREYELRILVQIMGDGIRPEVNDAASKQIWSGIGELRYLFRHGLLRDAAYHMQSHARLRQLHRQTAQAYEALHPTDLGPCYVDLAYHYGQAGDEAQERCFSKLAGEQAARRYAHDLALRLLSRARALTPPDEALARYELGLEVEQIHSLQGKREAQAQELADLSRLADALGPREQAEVRLREAAMAYETGAYAQGCEAAKQGVELAGSVGDVVLEARGHRLWGDALLVRGDYDGARAHHQKVLDAASSPTMSPVKAASLLSLGEATRQRSENAAARSYLERSLSLFRESGDRRGESSCLNRLGTLAISEFDFERSCAFLEQALSVYREMGDRRGEGIARNNLGETYRHRGRLAEAERAYQAAYEIFRAIGERRGESIGLNNLGTVARLRGDLASATRLQEQSLALLQQIGNRRGVGLVLNELGVIAMEKLELDRAEEFFQQALALRRELELPANVAEDLVELAQVALARRDREQATVHLDEVLAYLAENPAVSGAEHPFRVLLVCWRVLNAMGDPRAARVLTRARDLLLERAGRIVDEAARRSFLFQNPTHRRLMEAFEQHGGHGDAPTSPGVP
jgi:predicted ATPase/class 3 adenylate cyclase